MTESKKNFLKSRKFTLLTALVILFLCVIKLPESGSQATIPHLDKLVHFLMFLFLSFVYYLEKRALTLLIALFLAFYGAFIEFVQYFLPYRSADFFDWLADVLGILAVFPAIKIFEKLKHK